MIKMQLMRIQNSIETVMMSSRFQKIQMIDLIDEESHLNKLKKKGNYESNDESESWELRDENEDWTEDK